MANKRSKPTTYETRYPEVRAGIDMVNRLLAKNDLQNALELCAQLVTIEPENPEIHFTAATVLETGGNFDGALEAYTQVLQLNPESMPAIVNAALLLVHTGRYSEALELFARGEKIDKNHSGLLQKYAQTLSQLRRDGEAATLLTRLTAKNPDFMGFIELGTARDNAGDTTGAIAAFKKALELTQFHAPVYVMMARVALTRNERDEAQDFITKALASDSHDGFANLIYAQHFCPESDVDNHIAKLHQAISATEQRAVSNFAAPLNFALGRLQEKRGDHDAAFTAFSQANSLLASNQPQNDAERQAHALAMAERYNTNSLQQLSNAGNTTKAPVFILGMPRSGTTLVEQLLASHDDLYGLDEFELIPPLTRSLDQPDANRINEAAASYLASLPPDARSAKRFSDKSISSFYHTSQIAALFPNARFIAIERHPMDIAWSAFKEYFSQNALVYTYDFTRIAYHLRLFRELLQQARLLLGERLLVLRYEDIVADPEPHARAMIDHIGLDWSASVLDFHTTTRPVRTASLAQVRQPIYTSSVGGWQSYQAQLQPLADEISDLITAYKA